MLKCEETNARRLGTIDGRFFVEVEGRNYIFKKQDLESCADI